MRSILFSVVLTFLIVLTACTSSMDADNNATVNEQDLALVDLSEFPLEEISDEELLGLAFMREEEKLARDVYVALYSQWGSRVFTKIAASEQRHTDAIKALLERYAIADPFVDSLGVFTNQDLQNLYNDLMALGIQSYVDGLKVGALIEEVDIIDLQEEMAGTLDNQDILFVYQQLEAASHNHLRAFVRNLNRQGVVYEPQKLSPEVYQLIIDGQ